MAVAAMLAVAPAGAQDGVPDNSRIDLNVTDDPSRQYRESIDQRLQQDEEAARESGGTHLDLLLGSGEERPQEVPQQQGPVAEPVEEPEPSAPARRVAPESVEVRLPRGDGEDGLGMAIGLLFEQWNRAPDVVRIVYGRGAAEEDVSGPVAEERVDEAGGEARRRASVPRVAAGEGLYGRVLYGVSSDYPGPVLLEVLQRPLSGAVLRGAFEVVRERLVLRFSSMEYRGERVPVEALAVDPDCACYGVEGEVDRHFFERVLLPAALAFGQGYLEALASPTSTISTVDGDLVVEERADREDAELYAGAAGAARTLGNVLLETAPSGPTVTLARDTELVVVFMSALEAAAAGAGDG